MYVPYMSFPLSSIYRTTQDRGRGSHSQVMDYLGRDYLMLVLVLLPAARRCAGLRRCGG